MQQNAKKKNKALSIIKVTIISIVALVLVAVIGIYAMWHNEINTALSIRQLNAADPSHEDGAVYTMNVSGDYYFDSFLARGGAQNDTELLSFITSSITRGLIPMNMEAPEISCSAFTATDENGHRVMGRNYDLVTTNTCLVFTNPGGNRHASVSTVDLQFLGIDVETGIESMLDKVYALAAPYAPLDGVNDAGVACAIFMTYQGEETVATDQSTDKPDLTSTTLLRLVLDYASSVDEAVELISAYDLHDSAGTSYHYMIADKSGKSVVLEWVNGTDETDNDGSAREMVAVYNEGSWQVVTNFIIADGYYTKEEDMYGLDRYNILSEAMTASDGKVGTLDDAMDLLRAVGRRGLRTDPESKAITVHSVVYDLTDSTAMWVGNEHYGEQDHTFEILIKP